MRLMKDYYSILGVSKTATEDEIKSAFRKLAHRYHPDKKGGDEKKFKEVSEAYTILSDKKKRAEYDTYGRTFAAGGPSAGGGSSFGGKKSKKSVRTDNHCFVRAVIFRNFRHAQNRIRAGFYY